MIKIPFFRFSVTIEPGRSLLQFVTTNCLIGTFGIEVDAIEGFRGIYSIFIGGGEEIGSAIEVGAFQVVGKKSYYLTNTCLGEFKNITPYIINNKHTLNNHKYAAGAHHKVLVLGFLLKLSAMSGCRRQ